MKFSQMSAPPLRHAQADMCVCARWRGRLAANSAGREGCWLGGTNPCLCACLFICLSVCRVTGRGHIDINRISGYLSGKIVFYLMQVEGVCFSLCLCVWGGCLCV